jgi:hypothetical protein
VISGRIIFGQGSNSSGSISTSSSQAYKIYGGGNTKSFKMVGKDPTIRLPEFHEEGLEDPYKIFFYL